jgi:hypothetical protein
MKADSLADLVNMAATLHLPALQKPGPRLKGIGKRQHLSEQSTAKSGMKPAKLQHRVTRTRVNGGKLLEFGWL